MNKHYFRILLFGAVILFTLNTESYAQFGTDSTNSRPANSLMSIYSPYEGNLSLQINSTSNKNLKYVKVFDIIGSEIATIEITNQQFPTKYNIDLAGQKQNFFIFNLYSDKGLIESKKYLRGKL